MIYLISFHFGFLIFAFIDLKICHSKIEIEKFEIKKTIFESGKKSSSFKCYWRPSWTSRWKPPDSGWRSPYFHWRPHIFVGDPQIIVGDPHIFVERPPDYH